MKIIVDTNLWISFTIGKRLSILERLIARDDITVIISKEIVQEYIKVCQRTKF